MGMFCVHVVALNTKGKCTAFCVYVVFFVTRISVRVFSILGYVPCNAIGGDYGNCGKCRVMEITLTRFPVCRLVCNIHEG